MISLKHLYKKVGGKQFTEDKTFLEVTGRISGKCAIDILEFVCYIQN